MLIKNALASVAVNDLNLAIKWYEELFGKPADSRPIRSWLSGSSSEADGCRSVSFRACGFWLFYISRKQHG